MTHRTFGSTRRLVPVVGQGTWKIGNGDRQAAVAALRLGLDLGLTHIDTAEMYDPAEAIVGEAIAARRDEVFLVSKVLPSNASRRGTVEACERSLRRLRTGWLDCYLLHWPGNHPLSGTVAAFEELRKAGKIRSWGVSNFDAADLDALWRLEHGTNVTCNQVLYHLEERAIEHDVLPWCEARGVAVVAYSPFGAGRFPSPRSMGGALLQQVATRCGATTRQVALAFLARRSSVFTIPKAVAPVHVRDNAAAGDLTLSEDDVALLDRAFPRGPKPRQLPMI
jgi:diketogulonate reductase-like aldo/keto reductase